LSEFNDLIYNYVKLSLNSIFVSLSRDTSKTYVGEPFVPTKAIAVDMFPHTTHCELIIYFKRYSNDLILNENK